MSVGGFESTPLNHNYFVKNENKYTSNFESLQSNYVKEEDLSDQSYFVNDNIKAEKSVSTFDIEETNNHNIFKLNNSISKEEYIFSDKFKSEIEYEKKIEIKNEILEDKLFDSNQNFSNVKCCINKPDEINSVGLILNQPIICNNKEVVGNENKCEKLIYSCDLCHQSFNNKRMLRVHMKNSHSFNNITCSKVVPRAVYSEKSIQYVRPKRVGHNKPIFECEICKVQFSDYSNCRRHIRHHCLTQINNKHKPYRCQVCMQLFTRADNLRIHMRSHTGEKPFKCNYCQLSFNRNDNLKKHSLIHESCSLIYCDKCHAEFTSIPNMLRHKKRLHNPENLYVCDYCLQTFARKDSLMCHIRKHTGVKPYQCHICNTFFFANNVLQRHIKTHGKDKNVT